jgi:hypothetical protein
VGLPSPSRWNRDGDGRARQREQGKESKEHGVKRYRFVMDRIRTGEK